MPASIRSGIVSISAEFKVSTPSINKLGVPIPSIRAPIFIKNCAKLLISGSIAAFIMLVSPFANTDAINILPVAPTDEISKLILAPFKRGDFAII